MSFQWQLLLLSIVTAAIFLPWRCTCTSSGISSSSISGRSISISSISSSSISSRSSSSKVNSSIFRDTGLNARHFSEHHLFTITTGVTSLLRCAWQCSLNSHCLAFTYTPAPAPAPTDGTCRLHDAMMTSASPASSVAGARTFQLRAPKGPWLKKKCRDSAECPAVNSECFKGQCLCSLGFFFSTGSNICVDSCAEEDLGDFLVTYEDTAPFRVKTGSYMTIDDIDYCKRDCFIIRTPICRITIFWTQPKCEVVDLADISDEGWNTNAVGQTTFHRACA